MQTNTSGLEPTEHKVLIAPKETEEKTAGGIILVDMTKDKEKYAQTEGVIVSMSHLAFNYATPEEWGGKQPKPGDRVLYARHAGLHVKGPHDSKEYVLVNDKDVCAKINEG